MFRPEPEMAYQSLEAKSAAQNNRERPGRQRESLQLWSPRRLGRTAAALL